MREKIKHFKINENEGNNTGESKVNKKERNNIFRDQHFSWTVNLNWKFTDTNPRIKKDCNFMKTVATI